MRPRTQAPTLLHWLLCACALATPSLAAGPALTPVPGSERSWEVTFDIQAPEIPQGGSQEFAISLPLKSAGHADEPRSVAIALPPDHPNPRPVSILLEGVEAQPSRIALIRGPGVTSQAPLQFSFTARTWNTRIDEQIARACAWPEGAWASDLMPYLQADGQVESEILPIRTFVKALVGADPRAKPPYDLAKQLAAAAIDHCRAAPNADSDAPEKPDAVLARIVMGRAASDEELPVFLCAVYRAAGLPARLLRGVDVETTDSGELRPCRHTWVEFLLPSADGAGGEWIPVDIVRQRRISPRAPSPMPSWGWFGNNSALQNVIPFAASPLAAAHQRTMQVQALAPDCPICPDRAEQPQSDNHRGVHIRPAATKPDR